MKTPKTPQDLFEMLHQLVDSGPRDLTPMQDAVRRALGLPPRFGSRCGRCGQDIKEGEVHQLESCRRILRDAGVIP